MVSPTRRLALEKELHKNARSELKMHISHQATRALTIPWNVAPPAVPQSCNWFTDNEPVKGDDGTHVPTQRDLALANVLGGEENQSTLREALNHTFGLECALGSPDLNIPADPAAVIAAMAKLHCVRTGDGGLFLVHNVTVVRPNSAALALAGLLGLPGPEELQKAIQDFAARYRETKWLRKALDLLVPGGASLDACTSSPDWGPFHFFLTLVKYNARLEVYNPFGACWDVGAIVNRKLTGACRVKIAEPFAEQSLVLRLLRYNRDLPLDPVLTNARHYAALYPLQPMTATDNQCKTCGKAGPTHGVHCTICGKGFIQENPQWLAHGRTCHWLHTTTKSERFTPPPAPTQLPGTQCTACELWFPNKQSSVAFSKHFLQCIAIVKFQRMRMQKVGAASPAVVVDPDPVVAEVAPGRSLPPSVRASWCLRWRSRGQAV
jgi:hypothetical protein